MSRLTLSTIAIAMTLAGCAAAPPILTQQEITTAQELNSLDKLYEDYAARLATFKLNTPEGQSALFQLNELGYKLASDAANKTRQTLKQKALPDGLVPLPVFPEEAEKLSPLLKWSPDIHKTITAELDASKANTDARINELQDSLAKITENETGKRPAILANLAELSGDARYAKEREDTIAQLYQRVDDTIKAEQFEQARLALNNLKIAVPTEKSLTDKSLFVDTRLFEKQFWASLGEGKADEAYTQFVNLSKTATFPSALKLLSKSSDDMIAYFFAQAGTATTEGHLDEALKRIQQAQDLQKRTNSNLEKSPQEVAFLTVIQNRYQAVNPLIFPGVRLGYLAVIKDINPEHPLVESDWQNAKEAVAQAMVKEKVSDSSEALTELAKSYARDKNFRMATEKAATAFILADKNGSDTRSINQLLEQSAVSIPSQ